VLLESHRCHERDPNWSFDGRYSERGPGRDDKSGLHFRYGSHAVRRCHDQSGAAEVLLTGGVEHMSGVPYTLEKARWGVRMGNGAVTDAMQTGLHCGSHLLPYPQDGPVEFFRGKPYIMGHTAEFVALKLGITRQEQDEIALRSHNNVERATNDGSFADEIVPVYVPQKKGEPKIFNKDEHFRPGLTMEQLARLSPVFIPKTGTVTAGNASGINDGAAAMVIMSAEKAKSDGIQPLARIKAVGMGACDPTIMGLSPVPAVNSLLKRSGLSLSDFDLIELNEAFAAQYLGCERELKINREITNINGSGIGLGHPVGCTGARLMISLIYALKRKQDPGARHALWRRRGFHGVRCGSAGIIHGSRLPGGAAAYFAGQHAHQENQCQGHYDRLERWPFGL